jgi:hypothetical protein
MMAVLRTSTKRSKPRPHVDPYQLDPADVLEPPTGLGNILKEIGPGIVLSASIVGSGELIATTSRRQIRSASHSACVMKC